MRKYAVITALLLVLISASSVLALGEGQHITAMLTGETKASTSVSNSADGDNDKVIERSSRVPELEARISALEARRSAVVWRYRTARNYCRPTASYENRIAAIDREITFLRSQAFGGYENQLKAYKNLSDAGFITRGQADSRYQKKTTPPAVVPAKEKAMMIPTWALVVLALVLLYALFGRRGNAATPPAVRTLADPAAYGTETKAHRGEIGAPDPPPAVGNSIVKGYRVSGPNGTYSGESWTNEPARPAVEQPREALPPAETRRQEGVSVTVNNYGYRTEPGVSEDVARGRQAPAQ